MEIAVAQLGGRMHYAVPEYLAAKGLLSKLYTDFATPRLALRMAEKLPLAIRKHTLPQLLRRSVPGVAGNKVTYFASFGLRYRWEIKHAKDISTLTQVYVANGRRFCELVLNCGLGAAGGVYTFNSAGLELLQYARNRGLFGILEQTIAPKLVEEELLKNERKFWPGWEKGAGPNFFAEAYGDREKAEWAASDLILCGSTFVAEGIAAQGGPTGRCVVVPYGVGSQPSEAKPARDRRQPLRVLFCGAVGIRKGIGHLLNAVRPLGSSVDLRVIGSSNLTPAAERIVREVADWPGSVPRSQVREHFAWADLFILPSICEGSATVCYEALSAGLPVITTPNAGSTVRHGIDGFVVPICDSRAISEKLELFLTNFDLLQEMSSNAKDHAQELTVEKYGERLLGAIEHAYAWRN